MDDETYDHHKQIIEAGQVAHIGGLTASTIEELDYLREVGIVKPNPQDVINEMTTEISELAADKQSAEDAKTALTTENIDLKNQIVTLQKAAGDAQKAAGDAQKQATDSQAQAAELQAKNTDLQTQLTAAQSQLAAALKPAATTVAAPKATPNAPAA